MTDILGVKLSLGWVWNLKVIQTETILEIETLIKQLKYYWKVLPTERSKSKTSESKIEDKDEEFDHSVKVNENS